MYEPPTKLGEQSHD